jgi:hypothetical protein
MKNSFTPGAMGARAWRPVSVDTWAILLGSAAG